MYTEDHVGRVEGKDVVGVAFGMTKEAVGGFKGGFSGLGLGGREGACGSQHSGVEVAQSFLGTRKVCASSENGSGEKSLLMKFR